MIQARTPQREESADQAPPDRDRSSQQRQRVLEQIAEASQSVAQSWPMKTFAYRNPLRGFEHLPFDEAVREAKHLLGGNGYLPNDDYRQMYREGRISDGAIDRALSRVSVRDPQEIAIGNRQIEPLCVARLHLMFGIDPLNPALLSWQLNAVGMTKRFRCDVPLDSRNTDFDESTYLTKLWDSAVSALTRGGNERDGETPALQDSSSADVALPFGKTLSDWIGTLAREPLVERINEQMIKWTAAFVDEGMADWGMPDRQQGFYHAWRALAQRDWSGRLIGIKRIAAKLRSLPVDPEDAIVVSLDQLDIPDERRSEYMSRLLAQLPGWFGFVRWLGDNPGYAGLKNFPIDPVQYLAVRLFYEVELVQSISYRRWGVDGTLTALVSYWEQRAADFERLSGPSSTVVDAKTRAICRDAWRVFHLAQFLGLAPADIEYASAAHISSVLGWLDEFPSEQHGLVWLEALEGSYRDQLIETLSNHQVEPPAEEERPRGQFVMCIDARSESFRRHIEAQGPYETFGFAGFFGVPISFQAFDETGHAALCPVIASPGFDVHELPRSGVDESLETYASGSRYIQLGQQLFHDLKSNPVGSFMLIDALGLFHSVRLIGKTFLTKPLEAIKSWASGWFSGWLATHIPVDRDAVAPSESDMELPYGFSEAEQAKFVENGLRAFGLTSNFGRFIVICGHGSTSDNNPYAAAYNCGACGGGHGDPNARVYAAMGNQPHVRQAMNENGLEISDDTWFIAAKHNTATDQVTFYDVEDVPESHVDDLRLMVEDLEQAGEVQALERCRRLPEAPTGLSPQGAADHMVSRTVDWANVRPEWGLSSNAAFILGRRSLTKDVDLGARTFLHSYDPNSDPEGAILEALMNAPLVVAQWISMEYYFSAVDPVVYGSGSKVTHNVVAGVGVMHGAHGDLQSGLPLQGVNDGPRHYHEPVRLLAILEAPTSRISNVIQKHTLLQHLFHNQWVNLVAVDPETREFHRYHPDATWQAISPN